MNMETAAVCRRNQLGKTGFFRRADGSLNTRKLGQWIVNLVALGVAIIYLLPFTWMISTSLRPLDESYRMPPSYFPTSFDLSGYRMILNSDFPFFQCFLNSIVVTLSVTLCQFVTCTMAAFSFSRLEYPGKNVLFGMLLASLMVPIQVTMIPMFIMMSKLHLVDTLWSIILPYCTSVFGIFLLRQSFMAIPKAIEDSAKIDGAGYVRLFVQIMLPQVKPALASMAIICINGTWNNYFAPLVFISKWEKMTLPLGMVTLKGYMANGSLATIMAGVTLAALPIFILFICCQKNFVEGLAAYGVK